MRRITVWSLSTITILVLLLSYRTSTSSLPGSSVAAGRNGGDVSANGPSTPTDSGSTPSGTSTASSGSGTPKPPATKAAGATKTYTGASIDTNYGPVQVQITVVDGKVTKAKVTQVPWNDGRDQEINGYAVPILNKEVVKAQSGTIDMVSGATFTSDGYIQSLQSAIDKAHL
ncbi:FMN-binding protein [Pedococcus bigeumensis]|uniref:FMN-binding protein n=1 Tax=Pedococcus bigeumensis TaxID=433644 RepID=A0A502D0Q9_9MICO|nr:FMN-binding protein [Pedococcus bigeumensis]TPG17959.1 FMN-binding protein [Pedococcus bigeumensis]